MTHVKGHPKHVGVDLTGPMRTDRVATVRAGFGRAALAAPAWRAARTCSRLERSKLDSSAR